MRIRYPDAKGARYERGARSIGPVRSGLEPKANRSTHEKHEHNDEKWKGTAERRASQSQVLQKVGRWLICLWKLHDLT